MYNYTEYGEILKRARPLAAPCMLTANKDSHSSGGFSAGSRCVCEAICSESLTCPPSPPYPVDVSFNVLCNIIVDNRLDGRNV